MAAEDRSEEGGDVLDAMLAVGIEGDDELGPALESEFDAGLQGRSLAAVDGVSQDVGRVGSCVLVCAGG